MPVSPVLGWIVALLVAAILFAILRRALARPARLPYFSRQWLVSRGECAFYTALRQATPPHLMICPKVRLSDLVNCSGEAWKAGFGAKISQKHIDFVLADVRTTAIALVIELDDKSHNRADRRERDAFVEQVFEAAGLPMLRVPCAASYDPRQLAQQIAECARDTEAIGAPG